MSRLQRSPFSDASGFQNLFREDLADNSSRWGEIPGSRVKYYDEGCQISRFKLLAVCTLVQFQTSGANALHDMPTVVALQCSLFKAKLMFECTSAIEYQVPHQVSKVTAMPWFWCIVPSCSQGTILLWAKVAQGRAGRQTVDEAFCCARVCRAKGSSTTWWMCSGQKIWECFLRFVDLCFPKNLAWLYLTLIGFFSTCNIFFREDDRRRMDELTMKIYAGIHNKTGRKSLRHKKHKGFYNGWLIGVVYVVYIFIAHLV